MNVGSNINTESGLTEREEENIFYKYKKKYLLEDIKAKLEEMAKEKGIKPVSDSQLEKVAKDSLSYVMHGLENNTTYWESYWKTIEKSLESRVYQLDESRVSNMDSGVIMFSGAGR